MKNNNHLRFQCALLVLCAQKKRMLFTRSFIVQYVFFARNKSNKIVWMIIKIKPCSYLKFLHNLKYYLKSMTYKIKIKPVQTVNKLASFLLLIG
jgi:hypothetical protein